MATHDYMPLAEAFAKAETRDVQCNLVHIIIRQEEEMIVSVNTNDSDPTVALIEQGRPGSRLLLQRQESGPDRWDYPVHREAFRDQLALQLVANHRSALVVCAPFAIAHLVTFGWRDMTGEPIPVVVGRQAFQDALTSLTADA